MIVLNVGRVHLHGEQRAACIGNDVALAPFHSLARVKPAWAATFRGLHTLAVDDSSRGSALASCRSARALDQGTIDPPPNGAVAPIVKIVLHRRERRKVFRQGAPLAAGGKNIEDRIEDGPKWPLRRAPDALPLRQQAAQQNPFLSCRVACIAQSNAAILIAGGFGPSHGASLVDSQSRRNHNRLEITRFLFGQSLRMRSGFVRPSTALTPLT